MILPSSVSFIPSAAAATATAAAVDVPLPPSHSWGALVAVCGCWMAAEVVFWCVFHYRLVPHANRLRPTPPTCRAPYATDRHLLLRRIMERVIAEEQEHEHEQILNDEVKLRASVTRYLTSWFRRPVETSSTSNSKNSSDDPPPPGAVKLVSRRSSSMTTCSSTSSNSSSTEADADASVSSNEASNESTIPTTSSESVESTETTWTIPGISKTDMDDFLAWAMFTKEHSAMDAQELEQLQQCYHDIEETVRLKFDNHNDDDTTEETTAPTVERLEPRRLSIEPVEPLHRPLAVYAVVQVCQWIAGLVLKIAGFQRVQSPSTGLTGWFRPAAVAKKNSKKDRTTSSEDETTLMPLLFFHGIAPAGLFFYLPMILFGLLNNDKNDSNRRPCFLFDNRNIACCMEFRAFSEQETVAGVQEIVETHLPTASQQQQQHYYLTVCGHSFGSCQLTWLLLSEFGARRIRQYVLMDPVTVLLSDPDVMVNFLYCREAFSKIRMIASSELFTEYYLRRHFCWYNSELWLDELLALRNDNNSDSDNDAQTHAVIALSEDDAIVNSPKVKRHIDTLLFHSSKNNNNNGNNIRNRLKFLYWKNAEHASCVMDPSKWRQVRAKMLENELQILQQQQKRR